MMELWLALVISLIVLMNAHKVIGKFAIPLYAFAFYVTCLFVAEWLGVDLEIVMLSALGVGAVGFLIFVILVSPNERR